MQIVHETFLEDVNNILTSGEVPNLFPKDEIGPLLDEVRTAAKAAGAGETQDNLYAFFLERVRTNLHVILCMSPVGEAFRCDPCDPMQPHATHAAPCSFMVLLDSFSLTTFRAFLKHALSSSSPCPPD